MSAAPIITDPTGEVYGLPTFHWRDAPDGFATRRQLAAVWTAALSRYRCGSCGRRLSYIPRQAEPAFGRCWTCAGLPGDDTGEPECPCCHDAVTITCPSCSGRGDDCGFCHGQTLIACPACQPQFLH